jgi:uncharacterized protein (DUF427 family)
MAFWSEQCAPEAPEGSREPTRPRPSRWRKRWEAARSHRWVYYIPRKDVRMDRLVRTTHRTYCPFKGHAAYYSLRDGPENVAWRYEQPHDEMSVLRERRSL